MPGLGKVVDGVGLWLGDVVLLQDLWTPTLALSSLLRFFFVKLFYFYLFFVSGSIFSFKISTCNTVHPLPIRAAHFPSGTTRQQLVLR
jgi:hypothetical protein